MRFLPAFLGLVLLAPAAAAEFGAYDEHDYPIAVDGTSTFPGGVLPFATMPAGPLNAVGPLTIYPYYGILTAELQRLAAEHPDLVKLHSIGKSTLGLDLWMVEIANFDDADMLPLEDREVVWVDGGTHSNEYSGVWFAAHLASFLTDQYETNETARWIVENRHTWVMPMVNPDGSHAMGRLNANLVNVNRNYPVDWGALAEDALMNNPGPAPASEPETQANIAWFNKTQPDLYVSVHCCGNLWLYPYGVEGLDPLDQQALSRICDEAFPTVREDCGPIWSTIYPASGSSVDTVYEYTGAAAFGYEMSGRNAVALWGQPITSNAIETEEVESWEGLMHGFLNVHRYGAYPQVVAASITDDGLALRIRNDGYGNLSNWTVGGIPQPTLVPGEETTALLGAPATAGALEVPIEYVKRHMASPTATIMLALEVREGIAGLDVFLDGETLSALASPPATSEVPFPAALALLAVLAVARQVRRAR